MFDNIKGVLDIYTERESEKMWCSQPRNPILATIYLTWDSNKYGGPGSVGWVEPSRMFLKRKIHNWRVQWEFRQYYQMMRLKMRVNSSQHSLISNNYNIAWRQTLAWRVYCTQRNKKMSLNVFNIITNWQFGEYASSKSVIYTFYSLCVWFLNVSWVLMV